MKSDISREVYESLLGKMESGSLLPGMALPSENALTSEFGLSRPTVRKVLERLEREGRIIKRPGVGTFVNGPGAAQAGAGSRRRLSFAIDSYGPDYYNGILARGMKLACERSGCQLSISGVEDFFATGRSPYDGVVLASASPDDFDRYAELSAASGTPIVLINRFPTQSQLAYLSVDYFAESLKAVEHLISIGHRSIALIGARPDGVMAPPRRKGWEQAFARNGLPVPHELIFAEDLLWKDVKTLVDFLKAHRPSALFIVAGGYVPQVVHALGRANMRMPEDVSLICFDDMEDLSDKLGIPLSYVKMPLQVMGRRAIEHLIKRSEDPFCKPERAIFEASLVINSACRPLIQAQRAK